MASLRHTRAMKCYQVIQEKQWIHDIWWRMSYRAWSDQANLNVSDLSGSLWHHCSFEVLEILIASTPQPSRSQLYLLLKHVLYSIDKFVSECLYQDYIYRHIVSLQWHHWFGVFSYWRSWGCSYHLWSCWSMIQMAGEQSVISQTFHRYSEHLSCTSSLIYKFYISLANVASIAYCTSTLSDSLGRFIIISFIFTGWQRRQTCECTYQLPRCFYESDRASHLAASQLLFRTSWHMQLCKSRFRSGLFLTAAVMVFVAQVVSDRSEFSRPWNLCLQLARQDWSCDRDILFSYIFIVTPTCIRAKCFFDVFRDFLWVLFIWTGSRETNRWLPASLTQRPGSNPYFLIAWFSNCPDWKRNDLIFFLRHGLYWSGQTLVWELLLSGHTMTSALSWLRDLCLQPMCLEPKSSRLQLHWVWNYGIRYNM